MSDADDDQQKLQPITFQKLLESVGPEHTSIWDDVTLAKLTEGINIEDLNIRTILDNLNEAEYNPNTGNTVMDQVLKDNMSSRKKYVHVSLFASLSYVYIKDMIITLYDQMQQMLTVTTNKIQVLQQQVIEAQQTSSSQDDALKVQLLELEKKQAEYQSLDTVLKMRAEGLSKFIGDYTNALKAQAQAKEADLSLQPGEGQGETPGGRKKKKAQKGGFIRDGTRAHLAGEPYPKAS